MEDKILPQPAVAGVLTRHFIEARLHTDHPDEAIRARNLAIQDELQGSLATPYYFLVDPRDARVVGEFPGATFDAEEFRDFLKGGVERGRGERVAQAVR